jgi:probable HAF family extracellular repeat protein
MVSPPATGVVGKPAGTAAVSGLPSKRMTSIRVPIGALFSTRRTTPKPIPRTVTPDQQSRFSTSRSGWGCDSSLSSLYTHAVLWQNGTVTDVGTLGGLKSTAAAINDNGQIVGSAATSSGATDGFLYSNGTMTDLGSFTPAAVNNNGVMVGGQYVDGGGTMQNLNTLLPAGSATILDATAINDNGQIVAVSSNGAVLLIPN